MLSFNKSIKTVHQGVVYRSLYTEFEGYSVIHVDDLPAIAMTTVTYFDTTRPYIVTTPIFFSFSENAQKFILYHEIGHIVHDHVNWDEVEKYKDVKLTDEEKFEMIDKYFNERMGKFDYREAEADEYAVREVGLQNAISALREIKSYLIEFNEEIHRLADIKERKEALNMNRKGIHELNLRIRILKHDMMKKYNKKIRIGN